MFKDTIAHIRANCLICAFRNKRRKQNFPLLFHFGHQRSNPKFRCL